MPAGDLVSKPQEARKRTGGINLPVILFASVVYLLSPYPTACVLMLLPNGIESRLFPIFQMVYAPIQWLYEHFAIVEKFYDWYRELFFGFL